VSEHLKQIIIVITMRKCDIVHEKCEANSKALVMHIDSFNADLRFETFAGHFLFKRGQSKTTI